jgi:hypothetical protein
LCYIKIERINKHICYIQLTFYPIMTNKKLLQPYLR